MSYVYKALLIHASLSQQKFNLFREESEGYSKVIAELDTPFDTNSVDLVIEHLQSLIGV
jgi:THO complex subunit 2